MYKPYLNFPGHPALQGCSAECPGKFQTKISAFKFQKFHEIASVAVKYKKTFEHSENEKIEKIILNIFTYFCRFVFQ